MENLESVISSCSYSNELTGDYVKYSLSQIGSQAGESLMLVSIDIEVKKNGSKSSYRNVPTGVVPVSSGLLKKRNTSNSLVNSLSCAPCGYISKNKHKRAGDSNFVMHIQNRSGNGLAIVASNGALVIRSAQDLGDDEKIKLYSLNETLLRFIDRRYNDVSMETIRSMIPSEYLMKDAANNEKDEQLITASNKLFKISFDFAGKRVLKYLFSKYKINLPVELDSAEVTGLEFMGLVGIYCKVLSGAEPYSRDDFKFCQLKSGDDKVLDFLRAHLHSITNKILSHPLDSLPNIEPKNLYSEAMEVMSKTQSSLDSEFLDMTNPIAELSRKKRVKYSKDFAGGISASQLGRLGITETPESDLAGKVLNLAFHAEVDSLGFITAPFFRVKNGVVDQSEIIRLNALDSAYDVISGYYPDFKLPDMCSVVIDDSYNNVPKEEVTLIHAYPETIHTDISASLPLSNMNKAKRLVLPNSQMKQALLVHGATKPRITTGIGPSLIRRFSSVVTANSLAKEAASVNGIVYKPKEETVKLISFDAEYAHFQTDYGTISKQLFRTEITNQNTITNHIYVGKGREVFVGEEIIFQPQYVQDEEFAIGVSLRMALVGHFLGVYEDSVVMDQDLLHQGIFDIVDIRRIRISSEDDLASIIKTAQKHDFVGTTTPLIKTTKGASSSTDMFGHVIDDNNIGSNYVLVGRIKSAGKGDKIVGLHGNKGVISIIVPSYMMPYDEIGRINIILNPNGIPTRMNMGVPFEAHMGTKHPEGRVIPAFSNNDEIYESSLSYGDMTEVTLYNAISCKPYKRKVTVGYAYYLRLNHIPDRKINARKIGPQKKSAATLQSPKGRKQEGGGRFGEQEGWALQAHDARWVRKEIYMLRGDNTDVKRDFVKRQASIDKPSIAQYDGESHAFDMFRAYTTAMCLDTMHEDSAEFGERIIMRVLYPEEIRSLGVQVKHVDQLNTDMTEIGTRRDYKDYMLRRLYGYIELPRPIPNPLLMSDPAMLELLSFTMITKEVVKDNSSGEGGRNDSSEKKLVKTQVTLKDSILKKMLKDRASGRESLFGAFDNFGEFVVGTKEILREYGIQTAFFSNYDCLVELIKSAKCSDSDELEGFTKYNSNMSFLIKALPVLPYAFREGDGDKSVAYPTRIYKGILQICAKGGGSDLTQLLYHSVRSLYTKADLPKDESLTFVGRLKAKEYGLRGVISTRRPDGTFRCVIVLNPEMTPDYINVPLRCLVRNLEKPIMSAIVSKFPKISGPKLSKVIFRNDFVAINEMLQTAGYNIGVSQFLQSCLYIAQGVLNNDYVCILNRKPTLHKGSIQGFRIITTLDDTVAIHPSVCKAFNADFDGDEMDGQMMVSIEATLEVIKTMLSHNTALYADQDVVMGLYHISLTEPDINVKKFAKTYTSIESVVRDLDTNVLSITDSIWYFDVDSSHSYYTTSGRLLLAWGKKRRTLIEAKSYDGSKLDVYNALDFSLPEVLDKKAINKIYDSLNGDRHKPHLVYWYTKAASYGSTEGAYSILLSELTNKLPVSDILDDAFEQIKALDILYREGFIPSADEKRAEIWGNVTRTIQGRLKSDFESQMKDSAIYHILKSGARGDISQIRQIQAFGGVSVNLKNKILPAPIISTFTKGLNPIESMLDAESALKGLISLASEVSKPGELTRHIIYHLSMSDVTEADCKHFETLPLRYEDNKLAISMIELLIGKEFTQPKDMQLPCLTERRRSYITEETLKEVNAQQLQTLRVRTVLTCKADGICLACLGQYSKQVDSPGGLGANFATKAGREANQLTMDVGHNSSHGKKTNSSAFQVVTQYIDGATSNYESKLASRSGTISILKDDKNATVYLDDEIVFVCPVEDSLSEIKVKDGQKVQQYEKISNGLYVNKYTFAVGDPIESMLDFYEAYREQFVQSGVKDMPSAVYETIVNAHFKLAREVSVCAEDGSFEYSSKVTNKNILYNTGAKFVQFYSTLTDNLDSENMLASMCHSDFRRKTLKALRLETHESGGSFISRQIYSPRLADDKDDFKIVCTNLNEIEKIHEIRDMQCKPSAKVADINLEVEAEKRQKEIPVEVFADGLDSILEFTPNEDAPSNGEIVVGEKSIELGRSNIFSGDAE